MALLAEEWRRSRTMRRWRARTVAVQRSRTVSSGTGIGQGSRSEQIKYHVLEFTKDEAEKMLQR
jgi:hypothetical protein